MESTKYGDLQDGLLAHYLSQVGASDVNVENRLEREPFDWRTAMNVDKQTAQFSPPGVYPGIMECG